jgi:hypothetical protein
MNSKTLGELAKFAKEFGYNYCDRPDCGYASFVDEDNLPSGKHNWTAVDFSPNSEHLERQANGQVMKAHLLSLFTGTFKTFSDIPAADDDVYLGPDSPQALVRIRRDDEYTPAFVYVFACHVYLRNFNVLLEAKEIFSKLQYDRSQQIVADYYEYYVRDDVPRDEWSQALVDLLLKEEEDHDSIEYILHDEDREDIQDMLMDCLMRHDWLTPEDLRRHLMESDFDIRAGHLYDEAGFWVKVDGVNHHIDNLTREEIELMVSCWTDRQAALVPVIARKLYMPTATAAGQLNLAIDW